MTKEVQKRVEEWLASPALSEEDRQELQALKDPAELVDRFYRDLEFGTGGLRGVLGLGTNRMNMYTVRRATQGLAAYMLAEGLPRAAAISYDSRIQSDVFARETARVLAANGITAWLYPRLEPTPALSFAVRDLGCGAGVCITASHNPAKYNGYKVYGADGCQCTLAAAQRVLSRIEETAFFDGVKLTGFETAREAGLVRFIPEAVLDRFLEAVWALRPGPARAASPLRVVYTPLNGAGLECVRRTLERLPGTELLVVPQQEAPDGRFPTCPYPNPEMPQTMQLALELAKQERPDLVLGTDPDCDRCGAAALDEGEYRLLNGNQMGVLLLDYLCRTRLSHGALPKAPVAVTTIVSTDMAQPVCREYGVELRRTLTGFKFIGEQIGFLEAEGRRDDFLFGFEESYGYLSGSHVRDKDAVNAALLIAEMTRWYKRRGQTLWDAWRALTAKHGVWENALLSKEFEGADGMAHMAELMTALRTSPPRRLGKALVCAAVDYLEAQATGLPASNVLEFQLEDGGKLLVRPSGTEPKLKCYLSATAPTEEAAARKLQDLSAAATALLEG